MKNSSVITRRVHLLSVIPTSAGHTYLSVLLTNARRIYCQLYRPMLGTLIVNFTD
ncbi:hypothetical protein ES319_D09G010100v1 [Gossypium barbadense]|uniref:Uncharacterized protein n=2 Tax=Gossypium TaxID=3633 RepID=A0A5J5Q1L9_GOSBA|nr:hypothetical protein ES319_D09G010100v1 [Gossypium barbadense]TYG52245.1 hypothetical protein ES288_D09G011400v1 [Gossypium darwinii]